MPPDHSLDRPLIGYIKGSRFSVAVDAGSSAAHVELLYDELKKDCLPIPQLTVLTHSHWDHSFGLSSIHGISISNRITYKNLQYDMNTAKEELFRSYISEDYSYLRKEYSSPESIVISLPVITFSDNLSINAGDITIELYHVISPHTDDSTLVFVPSEGILFIGDASSGMIQSDSDLETGGKYEKENLDAFISSLRNIGAETIIHSHCGPVPAEEEIAYLEEELAKL